MVHYFKCKKSNNTDYLVLKEDLSRLNRDDDNYLVLSENEVALLVNNGRIIEMIKAGTYDLNEYDFDELYFVPNDEFASTLVRLDRPMTGKIADGSLTTFIAHFNIGVDVNDNFASLLEFVNYSSYTFDDLCNYVTNLLKANYKEVLKLITISNAAMNDNQYDAQFAFNEAIKKYLNSHFKEYGMKLNSHFMLLKLEVNNPDFFEDDYYSEDEESSHSEEVKAQEERTSQKEEDNNNFINNILKDAFEAHAKPSNEKSLDENLNDSIINSLFGGFFGGKK